MKDDMKILFVKINHSNDCFLQFRKEIADLKRESADPIIQTDNMSREKL